MGLRGMTWDHPRAYEPLEAAARRHPEAGSIVWDRQPLSHFESRPIEELARSHDLLVIDHPGLGAAIPSGALAPMGDLFDPSELGDWQAASIGGTWESYALEGSQWALPIDAATQTQVLGPRVAGAAPAQWAEVPAFAAEHRTVLCLGGPHALLMLLGMCADPASTLAPGTLLHPDPALRALALLAAVWGQCDQALSQGDPIAVHEAIARSAADYCPLAYAYASYARPAPGGHPLRWADAPAFASGIPGSVLGGTGLAVSAVSGADAAGVREVVRALMRPDVQGGLFPEAGGQPAARAAWHSEEVDHAWGRYYSSTRHSLETAWVRPRMCGWIPFQDNASDVVRQAIVGRLDHPAAIDAINAGFAQLVAREAHRQGEQP